MKNPAMIVPDAMDALLGLSKVASKAGIPQRTLELVYLRVSQINGCALCLEMHAGALKKGGDTDERLWTVAAWREAPYFTDVERAALALAEAVTRLSDRPDPVSDEVWNEAARHFDEVKLGALLVAIASINVWNRLNVPTRQPAGLKWG
jgi:AhpD family alkylhydroperoxidase